MPPSYGNHRRAAVQARGMMSLGRKRGGEPMTTRLGRVARVCCIALKVVLSAALAAWVTAAPLVWVFRDGLGPDMVETAGVRAVLKFLVGWGVPAVPLAAPLAAAPAPQRWLT